VGRQGDDPERARQKLVGIYIVDTDHAAVRDQFGDLRSEKPVQIGHQPWRLGEGARNHRRARQAERRGPPRRRRGRRRSTETVQQDIRRRDPNRGYGRSPDRWIRAARRRTLDHQGVARRQLRNERVDFRERHRVDRRLGRPATDVRSRQAHQQRANRIEIGDRPNILPALPHHHAGATEEPRGRKRMTFFPRFERRPGHRIRARFPVHGARVGNDGKRLRRLRNAGDQSPRAGTFPSRGRHQKKDRPRRQDDGGHDKDEDLAHRCYHPPRMLGSIVRTLSRALAGRVRRSIRRAVRSGVPLRIGVDIRPFYEPLTGIGWYLYHLLHEIAKRDGVELYLFGDARVTDLGPVLHADPPPNAHLCWFDLRGRGRISRPQRALTAAAYVLWMALIDCDVVFGANYFLPRLLGATARRRVITVHDLTWKRFPELLQKETLHNLDVHMAREIAAADAIICVSESTRNDLLAFYQVDPRRVVAIHSGVAPLPALRANLSSLR